MVGKLLTIVLALSFLVGPTSKPAVATTTSGLPPTVPLLAAGPGLGGAGDRQTTSLTDSLGPQPERVVHFLPPSLLRGGFKHGVLSFPDDIFMQHVREQPYPTMDAAKSAATKDALIGSIIVSAAVGGVAAWLVDEDKSLIGGGTALGYFALSFPWTRGQLISRTTERHEVLFDGRWENPAERGLVQRNGRWADPDREAWFLATRVGTPEAFRDYLSEYPGGQYDSQAHTELDSLDCHSWRSARLGDSVESYHAYLASFPSGRSVRGARSSLRDRLRGRVWTVETVKMTSVDAGDSPSIRPAIFSSLRDFAEDALTASGHELVGGRSGGVITIEYTERMAGESYTVTMPETRDVVLVPSDEFPNVPGVPPRLVERSPDTLPWPGGIAIPVTRTARTTFYLPTHAKIADLKITFLIDGLGEVLSLAFTDLPPIRDSGRIPDEFRSAVEAALAP
ncbi:MAG: hypothetical protein KAY32_07240 [Candidatus Eisenbacteria sp.]|nr:hypothetical protein [Candidatus Eisenbacteria bacterium]